MVRGAKSTLALLGVLVGLVAYLYFVDRNQPLDDVEERDTVFGAELTADEIQEIQITAADGETTRLRRTGDAWKVVEPVDADADADEVSSITSALASLEIQSVLEEDAGDLTRFGLDPARIEVAVGTGAGEEMQRLLIGDRTPTDSELYARLADSRRVLLISPFLDTTFDKNTFALRDKDVLKFDRGSVETLTLTKGSTMFEFAKRSGDWTIVEPIAARGEYGVIEGVVERLASAQMQRIVATGADDLRQYGLDRPAATLVVGTGSARATLTLGRTEDALVYAKDAARPIVFAVAPTIETDAFKALEDFRRKDLFDSRSFTATHAEFRRSGQTMAFDKTTRDDMDVWQRAGGGDVDTTTMDDLLSQITGLRAVSFESRPHASLTSPVLSVSVRFGEAQMETVTFGRAGDMVHAARSDEPGSATVDATAFDEALKALDAASAAAPASEPDATP